jgi:hypothetical protein
MKLFVEGLVISDLLQEQWQQMMIEAGTKMIFVFSPILPDLMQVKFQMPDATNLPHLKLVKIYTDS